MTVSTQHPPTDWNSCKPAHLCLYFRYSQLSGEQVPQASKYQGHTSDTDSDEDDDDDDDDDEPEEERGPQGSGKRSLNYIEVEAVGIAPPPPPLPSSRTGRETEKEVRYVEVKPIGAAGGEHKQRKKPAASAPVPRLRGISHFYCSICV